MDKPFSKTGWCDLEMTPNIELQLGQIQILPKEQHPMEDSGSSWKLWIGQFLPLF